MSRSYTTSSRVYFGFTFVIRAHSHTLTENDIGFLNFHAFYDCQKVKKSTTYYIVIS